MSDLPRPRLAVEAKREVVRRIVACDNEAEAAKIAEWLWAKLRGDMQDRITTLIHAAQGAVEARDMNARRSALRSAVRMLSSSEAAAMDFGPPPSKRRPRKDQASRGRSAR